MGEIIALSGLSIYTLGLVVVFCFFWGSFVFYKKGIESHFEENTLFDLIVLSAFWSFIFGRIFFFLSNFSSFAGHWTRIFLLVNFPGVDRWGGLFGVVASVFFWVKKKKGKYFDYFDFVVLGYLSAISYYWLGVNFINFYWQNILLAVFNFLAFLVFWKLEKSYRLISWYRGNKTFARSGFVTGFGVVVISFGYLLELAIFRQMNSLAMLWFGILLILGLAIVYIRSGRLLVDDIKTLKLWITKNKK